MAIGDDPGEDTGAPLIAAGVYKAFGDHEVLRGASLSVAAGEIVGLLGANGAGKSTFIAIATGALPADGGQVLVRGIDMARDRRTAALHLGTAPQELGVYPMLSVRENVVGMGRVQGLSSRRARTRGAEVIDALGLAEHARTRAEHLSGGQCRRLHTAMALVHEPAVAFLDEPTVGADIASRDEIVRHVRGLADAGAAVLYTTHHVQELEDLGAQVAVLAGGRIDTYGSVTEVLDTWGGGHLPPGDVMRASGQARTGLQVERPPLEEAYLRILEAKERRCQSRRSVPMLRNSLAVAALDAHIVGRDPAPVPVMIVVPLLFVPFLMPGARAQLLDLGHPHATGAEYAVPGLAILFSLLNAQQVITGFFRESDWGTWHRLRIAPVSFAGLLVGKSLTALAAQFLQLVVVLVGGGLLFGYRPNGSVPGLLVIAVLFSTTMVCFGMFLFAVCRTENQALTLSNIVAMAMAGFGGTFGPVAALPDWMQTVAPASPAYWALDAVTALSLDSAGLRDVLAPAGVLGGFVALFLSLAALAFRRRHQGV